MPIYLSELIPYSPQQVWQIVGDPARVDWVPGVQSCDFDGVIRRFTMDGAGQLSERILLVDDRQRRIEYGVVESAAPLTYHHASIQINPHADHHSELIWQTTVQPVAYEPFITQSMRLALTQLRHVLQQTYRNATV